MLKVFKVTNYTGDYLQELFLRTFSQSVVSDTSECSIDPWQLKKIKKHTEYKEYKLILQVLMATDADWRPSRQTPRWVTRSHQKLETSRNTTDKVHELLEGFLQQKVGCQNCRYTDKPCSRHTHTHTHLAPWLDSGTTAFPQRPQSE